MSDITLTIDGQAVTVEAGGTVLQAARQAGIKIPTICDHKDLTPYRACRMCIVEIEGARGYPTSCTIPAADAMQVRTQSPELTGLRRRTLELMLSGHPNSCLVCPHREACETLRPRATKAARSTRCGFCSKRGDCSLRVMALELGVKELRLPTLYAAHNLERDDPFMDRDYNLCILCGRCWRICKKIHGKPAISSIKRGKLARLGTAFGKSHLYSGCKFCGSCIDICPTGTLTDRFARWQGVHDAKVRSACTLCPEGCSIFAQTRGRQLISANMTGFAPQDSLCALGRFAYAQIVNAPQRLLRPSIRENGESFAVDWDAALQAAASALPKYKGALGILVSGSASLEDRHLYTLLAQGLDAEISVVPTARAGQEPALPVWVNGIQAGKIKAMILGGNFLPEDLAQSLEFALIIDCLRSPVQELAHVLLPAAVLSEVAGTFCNAAGEVKNLAATSKAPGLSRPEWEIVRDLGLALGLPGFSRASLSEITAGIAGASADLQPAPFGKTPRTDIHALPAFFRGHRVADVVAALRAFGLLASTQEQKPLPCTDGFVVLESCELVPNMHRIIVKAPQVAAFAKPGQFVIVMNAATSERTPFTLMDWDAQTGSITLVVEEVGRSTRELVSIRPGDCLAHVSGPLGKPLAIEKKGTVVLGGGCYGIGAIYPLARALRAAGNRVICVIEASSAYLLYMEKELAQVCDELRIATKDGSRGTHGGVQEVFADIVGRGETVDMFLAIGCTFMMRMVSETTRALGIPTLAALNPIMVDGTGMCGACRVSIHQETKFACIDGPIFDAHGVDWDELACRREAYAREEVEALPQTVDLNTLVFPQAQRQGCGC